MLEVETDRLTTGTGGGGMSTVTLTLSLAVPPAASQVIV
jgi:hypothetical protein